MVKATIAKDVVLDYPDFSKVFEIYTDASSNQLGAVITQDYRSIVSIMQQKYSVTKIELLPIIEIKRVQGHAMGSTNKSLYRPQVPQNQHSWLNIGQGVPMTVDFRGVWP